VVDTRQQGASFWFARVRVRGCYPMFGGTLAAGPCLGVGTEAVMASGFGSDHPASATAWIAIASLGGQVVLRPTPILSFRLVGEAIASASKPTFVIDAPLQQTVYQVFPVAFGATAGAEIHF
jgi:hypothetical protein